MEEEFDSIEIKEIIEDMGYNLRCRQEFCKDCRIRFVKNLRKLVKLVGGKLVDG